MDINPKHFTSGKDEFGHFVEVHKCEVILFPTNWIDRDPNDDNSVKEIYNYWLDRLRPVLKGKRDVSFLAADRVGSEYSHYDKKQICFMGGSVAISLKPPNVVVESVDKKMERYLKVTVDLPILS